jgi:F-type H+-transporting ATPase subunit epsilon
MADTFKFELVSPERLLVSGDVEQVLVPGVEGDFTVLAGHAPMLTVLKPGLLDIVYPGGSQKRFFVRGGFSETTPQGLTVLAETAIDLADLDAAMLTETIRNAEEDLADATDDLKRDKAQIHLEQLRQVQVTLQL